MPRKSIISIRFLKVVPMRKIILWHYANGAIRRLTPAKAVGGDKNAAAREARQHLLLFQKFSRRDRRNGGTGKIFDIPRKDIACAVPFCHGIHNRVFKVRHRAHKCGVNVHALYVCKGDDLGKLFDPLLGLLRGLECLVGLSLLKTLPRFNNFSQNLFISNFLC